MSVLSRHRTIPSPHIIQRHLDLDTAPLRPSDQAPTTGPSRAALLVTSAAIIAVAAVGTTAFVLAQDDPASPTTTVDIPFSSELQRDAATAARSGEAAAVANTEAQRDAAAAARHAGR